MLVCAGRFMIQYGCVINVGSFSARSGSISLHIRLNSGCEQ